MASEGPSSGPGIYGHIAEKDLVDRAIEALKEEEDKVILEMMTRPNPYRESTNKESFRLR